MGTPIRPTDVQRRQIEIPATRMQPSTPRPQGTEKTSFQEILSEAVSGVEELKDNADNTIKKLVAGEITDVTETMVAVQQADMSFQTMMTLRRKVMEAYQEIMRTQV